MTKEEEQIVRNSFLFQRLEEEEACRAIRELEGYIKSEPKGRLLFQEGDQIRVLGIILKGEIRISRIDSEGEEKLYQKLRPPYMLGADIVCTPSQLSPYTAYSSESSCVWYFPYERLKEAGRLKEESRAMVKERLLEFIANENIRKFYKVDMLCAANAREKILKYLRIQCRKEGSAQVEIPYNREELANYLCMNRSVLSHTLSRMQKEGILEFKKNKFYLKKY